MPSNRRDDQDQEQDRDRQIHNKNIDRGKGGRSFLTDRSQLVVSIIEVFFRTNFGIRYFNSAVFLATLLSLIGIRIFFSFRQFMDFMWVYFWAGGEASKFTDLFIPFDIFIAAFLVLSAYHIYTQKQMVAKGSNTHSWYIGDSRFAFLGKYINSKNPNFAAYVYIEPFVVFLLFFPIMNYSFILGIITIWGGGRLWYENYTVLKDHRYDVLDREDGKIIASHASASLEDYAETQMGSPPPIPNMRTAPVPPPIPLMGDSEDELTPMEALRRLNQKKKDANKSE